MGNEELKTFMGFGAHKVRECRSWEWRSAGVGNRIGKLCEERSGVCGEMCIFFSCCYNLVCSIDHVYL